jgi:hypothetical protein
MHFCPDVRSFAEDSKRFVTGGMEGGRVLAICLTWRGKINFCDLVCQKHPKDAFIQKGGEGTLGQTCLSRDAITTLFEKVHSTFLSKPNHNKPFPSATEL